MAEKPKLRVARDTVLELTYPPTTLTIATSKAAGHRLAKAIIAKGNQPSRPVATVDGLAIIARDISTTEHGRVEVLDYSDVAPELPAAGRAAPEERRAAADLDEEAAGLDEVNVPVAADDYAEEPPDSAETPVPEQWTPLDQTVRLQLRPFPTSNRREEALESGQAIAIPIGGEVPRGGECVFPLALLVPEPVSTELPDAAMEAAPLEAPGGNGNGDDDDDDLPVAEPAREWDLPARFVSGEVDLPRCSSRPPQNMIPIGDWARNREVLLPEKTILRPTEMALLLALGVDEVTIYRRPVVGVVSLGVPFPSAGRLTDREDGQAICPQSVLATALSRAARVAALPLGFAPARFHLLTAAVERWAQQVDILLLVGGSHHGPHCRGLDVLKTIGRVQLSGIDLHPGGSISTGKVGGQPVVVMPGGLPDVLAGFILLTRPLLHKYLLPHNYEDRIELRLENGSKLRVERDTAVPLRFGYDRETATFTTRYSGRPAESWLDFMRGQALVVLEAGRSYADGELITAHKY